MLLVVVLDCGPESGCTSPDPGVLSYVYGVLYCLTFDLVEAVLSLAGQYRRLSGRSYVPG